MEWTRWLKHRWPALLLLGLLAVALVPRALAQQDVNPNTDAETSSAEASGHLIVMFSDEPIASYNGTIPGFPPTQPSPGGRVNLQSPAAQAYAGHLGQKRQAFKNWLNQNFPAAQVVAEFEVVLNAVAIDPNGATAAALAQGPSVASVIPSYLYHLTMNRSTTLINAPTLWTAVGGQSNAGSGIKIGIIDTGIDQTHPFLTDNALSPPSGFPKCDATDSAVGIPDTQCKFVSNKVIVAKVFQTLTRFDAHAAQSHGTHVSGTAAGVANTCAPFITCTLSGVAPKAWLGNYNVFPGNVLSASSHDIAKAVEAAVLDGMDVLNLSLGGGARPADVLTVAVNHAVDAGLVVAIAAGNAGPGQETIESPGIAAKVITAGASTNPHFIGIPVTVSSLSPATFGAAVGQFNHFAPAVTATYVTIPSPNANGCAAISQNLSGEIALIRRGVCRFTTKVRNAQNAGAIGVIVSNNVLGDPIAMAQDGTTPVPTIPAVMVSKTNGLAMAGIAPHTATGDGTTPREFFTDDQGADFLAGFSSRGPAPFSFRIKPDLTAPGVNVYSSVPSFACGSPPCFAFFQGTSMATPHTAGSGAVLKQLHPTWSPQQIKSALVNSAHRPVKSPNTGSALSNPMDRGGGRIDLAAASAVALTVDPVSVGFGEFIGNLPVHGTQVVQAQNVSERSQTCGVSVTGPPIVTASRASLTVPSNGKATVAVVLDAGFTTATGDYFGDVVITCASGPVLNVPWWVRIIRLP